MSSHCLQLELSTTGFILASALCLFVTSVPDSEKPISYYLSFIYSLLTFSTWVHTQGRFITVNMDSCEKLFIDYSIVFTYSFLSFALQFPVRTPFPKVGQLLCPLTPFNKVKIYGNLHLCNTVRFISPRLGPWIDQDFLFICTQYNLFFVMCISMNFHKCVYPAP